MGCNSSNTNTEKPLPNAKREEAKSSGGLPPPPPPSFFTLQNIENQAEMFWAILDKDKSGTLSVKEVKEWVNNGDPLAQISVFKGMSGEEVAKALDINGDGSIARQEFVAGVKAAYKGGKASEPPPPPPVFTLANLKKQTDMFWAILDSDKSGSLSRVELTKVIDGGDSTLQIAAFKGHTGEEIMQLIDEGAKDGVITKTEFLAGLTKAFNGNLFKHAPSTAPTAPPPPPPFFTAENLENQIYMFWSRIDSNGDNVLNVEELVQLTDSVDPVEQIPAFKGMTGEQLLALGDISQDGKISREEFFAFVKTALEAKQYPVPPPPPIFNQGNIVNETAMFWSLMDVDQSGALSLEEVCEWIDGDKLLVPSCFEGMSGLAVMELLDMDGLHPPLLGCKDGKVTQGEFMLNVEKAFGNALK